MSATVVYCNKHSDIPKVDHYAIIESTSVHIPGDERSRTNPGHGYPASTEHFINYIAYLSKAEWTAEIVSRMHSNYRDNFRAIAVRVPRIEVGIKVE